MWTWILVTILGLLIIILFLPLTTVVKFNWNRDDRGFQVEFIPGFKAFSIEKNWNLGEVKSGLDQAVDIIDEPDPLTTDQGNNKEKKSLSGIKQLLWVWYWWNSKAARRRFKRIRLRNLIWQTSFSTGDVAMTGVVTGMVWAVKGWLLGLTGSRLTLEKVKVEVWPTWDHGNLQTSLDCIVSTRLVHIIGIGISAAWYYLRYRLAR